MSSFRSHLIIQFISVRRSEERPKLLVSFSTSCYPNLVLYINTDQLERSRLIYMDSDSLYQQYPEN